MKALLILIVTVGTAQANVETVDSSLEVRQIEFSSVQACERAADRLNTAGRATTDWAKTFALSDPSSTTRDSLGGQRLFVAPPTVIAQCLEVG